MIENIRISTLIYYETVSL